jgi:hypothetical protein
MRRQTDQIVHDDAARPRLHVASGDEPHGGWSVATSQADLGPT